MDFVIQYWIEFIFGLVGTWMIAYMKKQKRENRAIKNGMQAVLRDRFIQMYNHYMERGCLPIYAWENIESMYNAYHDLGGNGTITELYNKLKKLPQRESMNDEIHKDVTI